MDKEFIPYELALELKQLRFNEPCFGYYEPNKEFKYINWEIFKDFPYLAKNSEWEDLVAAATYAQAFRWFRDKHQLIHHMYWVYKKMYDGVDWIFHIKGINMINNNVVPHDETRFETYEEAELECLKKLIKIIKK
jgi:hypothetical protein